PRHHCSVPRLCSLACCRLSLCLPYLLFFFFNDPATSEIYTLSLHDALPIFAVGELNRLGYWAGTCFFRIQIKHDTFIRIDADDKDRKSTRLNSSHVSISYAVFCLKKKKTKYQSSLRGAQVNCTRPSHNDHSS